MTGSIGQVGRIGTVGGLRRQAAPPLADFTLSNAAVTTSWGTVQVGILSPINAPAGAYFMLVETAAASGDEAGLAVVNG